MSKNSSTIPGWFGKIPFLGDFASRRLPQAFITQWDIWLQHCVATSRARLGQHWLDIYLHSPIYRFALQPGVIGATGWAGIMMPSVDNVGRYFPLTIVIEIAPENFMASLSETQWFTSLEQITLSTLDMNFSVDDLEVALAANPLPVTNDNAQKAAAHTLRIWLQQQSPQRQIFSLPSARELPLLLSTTATQLLNAATDGRSLWWTNDVGGAAKLCCFAGLPSENDFTDLLQGEFR